jgi:hypothetical protein
MLVAREAVSPLFSITLNDGVQPSLAWHVSACVEYPMFCSFPEGGSHVGKAA